MTGHQSLGQLYLDLIRDGADVDGYHGDEYDRQVWRALVRSAMSAAQCGQELDQWHALVSESISTLGQQARRKGGRQTAATPSTGSCCWTGGPLPSSASRSGPP